MHTCDGEPESKADLKKSEMSINNLFCFVSAQDTNTYFLPGVEADLGVYQPGNKSDGRENEDHRHKHTSYLVCHTLDWSLEGGETKCYKTAENTLCMPDKSHSYC